MYLMFRFSPVAWLYLPSCLICAACRPLPLDPLVGPKTLRIRKRAHRRSAPIQPAATHPPAPHPRPLQCAAQLCLKRGASIAAVATRSICIRLRRDVGRRPVAQRGSGAGRALAVVRMVPGRNNNKKHNSRGGEGGRRGGREGDATTTNGCTVGCGGADSDAQRTAAVCAQAERSRRRPTAVHHSHAQHDHNTPQQSQTTDACDAHSPHSNDALRVDLTRSALPLPPLLSAPPAAR